ncbi:hypothetical protein M9H77_17333 [Catharanthus roseus]|uniref:Uncharacterized protein n=1 Tax=Catharanthus roseus TaxID=4058 RepID=A0ACC0B4A6_CATRO|nr:hypothetical protein M9H77_17333 [Catharanthus roseus]
MTEMAVLLLPRRSKNSSSTTPSCATTPDVHSMSISDNNASMNCCGLSKLVRKLKKHGKILCPSTNRQSSFQCRYDPMSYLLNFDTPGSGSLLDEDYYKFYAFSSRFVANSNTPGTDCQRELVTSSH